MRILITGSNGLLGQKLIYALRQDSSVEVIATAKGENRLLEKNGYQYASMDITDKNNVFEVLSKYKPDVLIHTAAMTNVDACETEQEQAKLLNHTAVDHIITTLESLQTDQYQPYLLHLSTDFIFDGTHGPLTEEEQAHPLSYYAKTKLWAEQTVINSKLNWGIARTVLVYGITDNMSRSNIVLWVKSNLEQGKSIQVVHDQFRTPTLAEDLAQGCILMAKKRANGIYNISGKDFLSVLDIAILVADYFGLDKNLIKPVRSESIKQPAKRPPITGFNISKAQKDLGYSPHSFEEGIRILMQQVEGKK